MCCKRFIFSLLAFSIALCAQSQSLPFEKVHTYNTGHFDALGTRHIAYDINNNRLFSINQADLTLDILDYTDVYKPFLVKSVDLSGTLTRVRSVDARFGTVAVTGDASSAQLPGRILFFNGNGNFLRQFSVGITPDFVRISDDATRVIVANEGLPDSTYNTDPFGSISILDLGPGISNMTNNDVVNHNFQWLDSTAYDPLILVTGKGGQQPPSQDLEPKVIAITEDRSRAFVVLQENNSLAVVDVFNMSVDTIFGLGFHDHGQSGLDPSDQSSAIKIDTFTRLYGIYQPGSIASFAHQGQDYILTANQGAPRRYSGYTDVNRVRNQPLDPVDFPQLTNWQRDTVLGRLEVSLELGLMDSDFLYDSLFAFGTRSFSIWDDQGNLVWDSGEEIEQMLASLHPAHFNSDYDDNNSFKSRSDNQGAEPAVVATGSVDNVRYAFIGLKRMGGFMIYDISDPTSPQFVMYELNRDFSASIPSAAAGDLGPSAIEFVEAQNTVLDIAQLYVAHEISGTITAYQLGQGVGLPENASPEVRGFYPNPSEGIFHAPYKGSFQVYNSGGKLVRQTRDAKWIDLSDQPAGLYIIRNTEGQALRVIKR